LEKSGGNEIHRRKSRARLDFSGFNVQKGGIFSLLFVYGGACELFVRHEAYKSSLLLLYV
jgi:hypothetical protein